ncbi:MAG: hypothetical protein J6C35_06915 [Bacteroidales bacterium]|nr:hypothetical protein [Bacteroidales bacterium]
MGQIDRNMPELAYLLTEVEKKYGRRIATTTDFESLSVVIEHQIGELISSSTLKRLWGYVSLNPTPRVATLDVLSRFVGHRDFKAFCNHLKESQIYASNFFTARCQTVAELKPETIVHIGWAPNRLVKLRYMGDYQFVVLESDNSQLQQDDRFELSEIIVGYPLYISRIFRDGAYTPPYVAGHIDGINLLKVEAAKG